MNLYEQANDMLNKRANETKTSATKTERHSHAIAFSATINKKFINWMVHDFLLNQHALAHKVIDVCASAHSININPSQIKCLFIQIELIFSPFCFLSSFSFTSIDLYIDRMR